MFHDVSAVLTGRVFRYPSGPCILSILPNNSSGHYKKATTTFVFSLYKVCICAYTHASQSKCIPVDDRKHWVRRLRRFGFPAYDTDDSPWIGGLLRRSLTLLVSGLTQLISYVA